jgi:hypothetical protein
MARWRMTLGRSLCAFLALSMISLAAGCGSDEVTAPKMPVPPSQVERYEVDSVTFVCGTWHPRPCDKGTGLFDVVLGAQGSRPTDSQRSVIRAAGGTIVFEFNAPIIRAVLDTAAVRKVGREAHGVPDAFAFPVRVVVMFEQPPTASDIKALADLGAVILSAYPYSGVMAAIVPDSAIPTIRKMAQVLAVDPDAILCGQPN